MQAPGDRPGHQLAVLRRAGESQIPLLAALATPCCRNCHCSSVRVAAAAATRFTSALSGEMSAVGAATLDELGAGPVSTPWQPRPKMHVQLLSRNVTSKTQVRSSSGSGKLTHS